MQALYLLTRAAVSSRPGTTVGPAPSDAPLLEIRPGAFARWMAEVEAEAAEAEAGAARGGFATNEGIAAARPDALPEPT